MSTRKKDLDADSYMSCTPPSQKSRFKPNHIKLSAPTIQDQNSLVNNPEEPSKITQPSAVTSQTDSTCAKIVDDTDDFLLWKKQFEEEKNNPLGIEMGIGSALTTSSATSAQRLMIIGQIQEPEEDDAEHPERAYFKNKALQSAEKG